MRWERLFADLEAQLAASHRADLAAEVHERVEAERAAVTMAARLAAHRGRHLTLALVGGDHLRGVVSTVAADWILLEADWGDTLVPLGAVTAAEGLEHRADALGAVESRLKMASALRSLSRTRVRVNVATRGRAYAGVIAAVGEDHLDLRDGTHDRTVPFGALVYVRPAAVM